jgi:hypothetical protein
MVWCGKGSCRQGVLLVAPLVAGCPAVKFCCVVGWWLKQDQEGLLVGQWRRCTHRVERPSARPGAGTRPCSVSHEVERHAA